MLGTVRHRILIGVFVGGVVVAACSSGTSTSSTQLEAAPSSVTTTTTATTTSTSVAATTTVAPNTTTTVVVAAASAIVEFEVEEGWRYRATVFSVGTDPNSSPGGCVNVAPPGQTNLVFALLLESLIDDRDAPIPQLVAVSNILDDGTAMESVAPFSDELDELDNGRSAEEIVPNRPGISCVLARSLGDSAGDITAGQVSEYTITLGTVNEDSVNNVLVGMRFFTDLGEWVEAIFTLAPDSATITTGSISDS